MDRLFFHRIYNAEINALKFFPAKLNGFLPEAVITNSTILYFLIAKIRSNDLTAAYHRFVNVPDHIGNSCNKLFPSIIQSFDINRKIFCLYPVAQE